MNEIEQEFEKNVAELWKLDRERIKALEVELKERTDLKSEVERLKVELKEAGDSIKLLDGVVTACEGVMGRLSAKPLHCAIRDVIRERDQAQAAAEVMRQRLEASRDPTTY